MGFFLKYLLKMLVHIIGSFFSITTPVNIAQYTVDDNNNVKSEPIMGNDLHKLLKITLFKCE